MANNTEQVNLKEMHLLCYFISIKLRIPKLNVRTMNRFGLYEGAKVSSEARSELLLVWTASEPDIRRELSPPSLEIGTCWGFLALPPPPPS